MDNLYVTNTKRKIVLRDYEGELSSFVFLTKEQFEGLESEGFYPSHCATFWAAASVVGGKTFFRPYVDDYISVEEEEVKTLNPAIVTLLWEHSEHGAKPLNTIKFIRQCFSLGLKEAKDIWDEVKATKTKENL